MVLESYGYVVPEITLRELCECDDDGTFPSKVIEAAKHFGLSGSHLANLLYDELREELARGLHPIVYLYLSSHQLRQLHSVVVVEIVGEQVHVLDPSIGERTFSNVDFERAWILANRRTIIIE
jgi:ABC-type bacteriocin/lantibiotic exporter with double-glycine peptidase domain